MQVKKLEEIAEIFSGVQISRFKDKFSKKYPVIKNKFLKDEILEYDLVNISNGINQKYFSKKGDIIISLSQPNKVSILHEEGYIIPMYFAVIRLKESFDPFFIYHLLDSEGFHKQLYSFLEGGSLKIIKVSDLKRIQIRIPDYEKQVEYAKFFNLVDRKNQLLTDKKRCNEKLKEYVIKTELKGE